MARVLNCSIVIAGASYTIDSHYVHNLMYYLWLYRSTVIAKGARDHRLLTAHWLSSLFCAALETWPREGEEEEEVAGRGVLGAEPGAARAVFLAGVPTSRFFGASLVRRESLVKGEDLDSLT